MDQKTLIDEMRVAAEETERYLSATLQDENTDITLLFESMRYSVMAGGKRIRPFLTLAFCRLFGGEAQVALPLAAAVEMIHTYSLIHDDLPCMDNDDYRRGKLTNHKVYGEAQAILAGDALLTMAFETLSRAPISCEGGVRAVRVLARAAGARGMVGGQVMDIQAETVTPDLATLQRLHEKKTGALISAAAELGCIAAGVEENDPRYRAACLYAANIGLAFQIIDDILDQYGNEVLLGKQTGQDEKDGKTTFLSFMNKENAEREASRLTEVAKNAIGQYPGSVLLLELAEMLLIREK